MKKWGLCIFLAILQACLPNASEEQSVEWKNEKAAPEKVVDFQQLTWKDLDSLKVSYYFDADYGDYLGKPSFSEKVKGWDGKNVSIEGYWIPVSEIGDSTVSVLSALPYAQCFFCSGAGIETVMQIKANKLLRRMDTDEKVALKGRFLLNRDNPMELYYQLVDASGN